jgi:hypothetical protein
MVRKGILKNGALLPVTIHNLKLQFTGFFKVFKLYALILRRSVGTCMQGDSEISLEKKCGVSLTQNNSA